MWSFLNPLFLWAAGAATIPLLLHLLQRRRTVPVRFSTIRFLQLAQKRSASRVRLENLLLWLLRTLLLLLLALAFALPVLRTSSLAGLLGQARRDVAIVWDASYSMGYESGRQNVWESSRDAVAAIVKGLAGGDRVCLFLAADQPVPLLEQPTGDLDLALSLLKAQRARSGSSRLAPAIQAAARALTASGGRERELYVFTDGQALPWAASTTEPIRLPPELARTPLFLSLLGPATPQNVAPLEVELQPQLLMTNTAGRLAVKLTHTGPAVDTTVALFVDDAELGRRTVNLGVTGGAEALFVLPPLAKGPHAGRVESPADGLPADNALWFLLHVRDRLNVLCVGSEADTFFVERALSPPSTEGGVSSPLTVRRVAPADLAGEPLEDQACVILCNALPLPGQALLNVENYVRQGGGLVVFPGDAATVADYASWSCLPAVVTGTPEFEAVRRSLRLTRPLDPVFQGLKLPPGTTPAVSPHRALAFEKLPGDGDPQTGVLLQAGDGLPFLLARGFGQGRVFLFAVAADRRWSDWPLSPMFLPVLHQVAQQAAGGVRQPLYVSTGEDVEMTDVTAVTEGAELVTPAGERLPVRSTRTDGKVRLSVERLDEPGVYRSAPRGGGEPVPVLAANLPRRESNLVPLEPARVPALFADARLVVARDREELLHAVEQHRVGRPLDEVLLWAVFALALVEVFVANRAGRRVDTVLDRLKVDLSGRVREGAAPQ